MGIRAITPLDGRYASQIGSLSDYFSEWALIKHRVKIEIEWLIEMSESAEIRDLRILSTSEKAMLAKLIDEFDDDDASRVKDIEETTRHDVKAVEYFIREKLNETSLFDVKEWVHFCCTSEDINNLAYALMLKGSIEHEWIPSALGLVEEIDQLAEQTRNMPLLARTHGQAASPTTLGKELSVFEYRFRRQLEQLKTLEYLGKFNGAVGSYNAHMMAYPEANWDKMSRLFVERLGLTHNPLTTQIEPHDYLAELFHVLMRFNTIELDFDRDMWAYISAGVFKQTTLKGQVGSSTMPHKVNPINFENSEANVGISNALLEHLSSKLQVSRLQRDLTDSSALRNIGAAIGHSIVALKASCRGLSSIQADEEVMLEELDSAWEVLGEAVQTVLRKNGEPDAYEKLKDFTQGRIIDRTSIRQFISSLVIPSEDKARLLALTPSTYTGISAKLVDWGKPV